MVGGFIVLTTTLPDKQDQISSPLLKSFGLDRFQENTLSNNRSSEDYILSGNWILIYQAQMCYKLRPQAFNAEKKSTVRPTDQPTDVRAIISPSLYVHLGPTCVAYNPP